MAEAEILAWGGTVVCALALGWSIYFLYRLKEKRLIIASFTVVLLGLLLILPHVDQALPDSLREGNVVRFVMSIALLGAVLILGWSIEDQRRLKQGLKEAYDLLETHSRERTLALREHNQELEKEFAERRRAEEKLLQCQARSRLIHDIASVMRTGMSVDQIVERTLEQVAEHFPGLRAVYSTVDDKGRLTVVHGRGTPRNGTGAVMTVDLNRAPEYLSLLRQGQLVAVEDIRGEPRLGPLAEVLDSASIRSRLEMPVEQSDRLAGLLSLESSTPHPWTEHEETTLREVTGYLKAALREARVHQEQRQAEQVLRRQAEMIDRVRESVITTDLDGRILSWNRGAADIYGYSAEEAVGKHISILADPCDIDKIKEHLLAQGSQDLEVYCRRKSGEQVCVHLWVWLQRKTDGSPCAIIGYSVDITQHKRAKAELETRVKQQEAVAELGQAAMAGGDLSTILRRVVDLVAETLDVEHCSILELLPDEKTLVLRAGSPNPDGALLSYRSFSEAPVIIEDLTTETRFEAASLLAKQGLVSGMTMAIQGQQRSWGVLGAYNTRQRRFSNDDLHFFKAIANLLANLLESKRAAEALRAERDYSAAIIEGNPAIICAINLDGEMTYINPAVERITGYPAEELVGKNWCKLFFPGDDQHQSKLWLKELGSGVRDLEMVLTTRSGKRCTISWHSTSRKNDAGETIEIIGFARDITRRKQLEEQLHQSQKMEAIGRLAGGVAHDFNNLLTVISGYSDLILEDLDGDSALYSDVEEILKASERAASLTRQLLAFSRRQVLKPRLINLSSVVNDSEKMLRRLIGEDIDLVTALDEKVDSVQADPGQIEQVILNLAVNARDAMPDGGRMTIETKNIDLSENFVSRHPYAQTGPQVLLAVTDTGVGMDEETRSRVFEPFFTTKEPGKGTGLGLSTVYGIVKQSGGSTWVESDPTKGTTVKICLPRVERPAEGIPLRATGTREQRGAETVLLVEDEPSVRTMVRRILQDEGYQVLEASEGEQALEIASQNRDAIRLLLTDVVMPRMGGRELAQRLAPEHPGIKVVYMTGYTDQSITDAPFLHKPFTAKGLLGKLRDVLDSPQAPEAIQPFPPGFGAPPLRTAKTA